MLIGWCGGVDWIVLAVAAFFPRFTWGRRFIRRLITWLTSLIADPA